MSCCFRFGTRFGTRFVPQVLQNGNSCPVKSLNTCAPSFSIRLLTGGCCFESNLRSHIHYFGPIFLMVAWSR
jgi:hypothetical protein